MDMQQAKGADITDLQKLKAQIETDKSSYTTYSKQAIAQSHTTQAPQAETMADAVDTLLRVSKGVPTDLGIDALHDAYYHGYLVGNGDIEPAVKMALRSIEMALASSEVAAGDKAALLEMRGRLENIDSEEGVGDNGIKSQVECFGRMFLKR